MGNEQIFLSNFTLPENHVDNSHQNPFLTSHPFTPARSGEVYVGQNMNSTLHIQSCFYN